MHLFKEIDFFGIYFSPFFACVLLAWGGVMLVKPWLDFFGFQHYVWNRALVDAALFAILLSLLTFLL